LLQAPFRDVLRDKTQKENGQQQRQRSKDL
jgi:hypothetical protein